MRLQSPAPAGEASPLTPPAGLLSGRETPPPTGEQQAIIDAYLQRVPLVVEALAGTGKTTTLRMLAAIYPSRPGTYLAYNAAIVADARGKFPVGTTVATAHSLAYQAIGRQFAHRLGGRGKGSRRLPAKTVASILKVRASEVGGAMLNPVLLTRLAEATVNKWCQSGDLRMEAKHLPARAEHLAPIEDLAPFVLRIAERIWQDLRNPTGQLYFTHDHYLKMWQVSGPKIYSDYILFDEAQDANPAIAAVIKAQDQAQRVYVGDRNQQLYAWRGAVDAMNDIDGQRLALTKSFRFGPAIAQQANEWLALLGSPLQVVGHDPVPSRLYLTGAPDAILCRTNGAALSNILLYQKLGVPVAMAPGDSRAGMDIKAFAWAAQRLMRGEGTDHPELCAFTTWKELLDYVAEEENADDLGRLVNIVNRIGPMAVIEAIERLVTKDKAEITVSTAHKAKGLEWDRVKVADDFTPPPEDESSDRAELMLNYVTVTRAKLELHAGALTPALWGR